MFKQRGIWLAYLIVFVSSACSLIIELVAGRIMAPYIGVSLYTWTSIIGVVLAGISLGNYLGGRIADRWASRTTLSIVFFAAGMASLAILPATQMVSESTASIPLVPKIVLFTAFIFFVPSLTMGMTSPIVIKLSLADLNKTGNVVGKIYALSTVGSIFGTFITGFVLVSLLGTRTIVWLVALVLILMGVAVSGFWRSRDNAAIALLVVLLYGGAYTRGAAYHAPCDRETNYYCIRLSTMSVPEIGEMKALVLDHLVHSYVDPADPSKLGYGYERNYAELTAYMAARRQSSALDTLFIGGGGYTFPRYVAAVYPESSVKVVEIDPGVTAAAHDYLGMPRDTTIKSYNQDARMFFAAARENGQYDVIYGDAFNDLSVPYHLTTLEFDRQVRDLLKPDGYYLANVIDNPSYGQFLRAFLRTAQQVFPYVYLLAHTPVWTVASQNTFIVAASGEPLDVADFRRVLGDNGRTAIYSDVMPPEELVAFLATGPEIVLTDDYAPVDQLVAPLFVERGY